MDEQDVIENVYENLEDVSQHEPYGFRHTSSKEINVIDQPSTSITLQLIINRNLPTNWTAQAQALKEKEVQRARQQQHNRMQLTNTADNNQDEDNDDDEESEHDLIAKKILSLTHIRLDGERIGEIDNLAEYLRDVSHVYLQHNLIRKIENLMYLSATLKFLVLSHNYIERLENLTCLKNIKLLDVSHNRIDLIDVTELPNSLVFLDLRGNECMRSGRWKNENYAAKIQSYLPNLIELNGQEILIEDEKGDNDDEDEQEKEISVNRIAETKPMQNNDLEALRMEILERSLQRQQNDVYSLDRLSQRHRVDLDEMRKSFEEKFANRALHSKR